MLALRRVGPLDRVLDLRADVAEVARRREAVTPHDVAELKARIAGRAVVASVSGGKDSAAMSLYLTELGIEHDRMFCDTGWEADETYAYIRETLTAKLGAITWLRADLQMEALCEKKGMFPSRVRRFCTEDLKVEPIKEHLRSYGEVPIVNCIGIRAGESEARKKMAEWEPFPPGMAGIDVEIWRPIISWTLDDVIAIHKRHNLPPNPLYIKGASRVGCWPCIFARKDEIALISKIDPARIDKIRGLEQRVGDAAEARQAAKGTTLEEQGYGRPHFFVASQVDETGKRRCTPIDEVVQWSKTVHGGKQLAMFDAPVELEGCMRWGMCETHPPDEATT